MIDLPDDEALAAEYVLGTLDAGERVSVEARRARDTAFDALILQWEHRFAPLASAAPALAPPSEVLARLMARLPAFPAAEPASQDYANDNILIMRSRMRRWRSVAVAASALAAVLALWIVSRTVLPETAKDQTYVAVLQHGADQPSFVVSLDLTNRRMSVMPLAVDAPAGKSYELWMIGADKAVPRSMGVINAAAPIHPNLPDVGTGVLSKATYAVTLEPQGGSPDGKPSGAPVFLGKLINTTL